VESHFSKSARSEAPSVFLLSTFEDGPYHPGEVGHTPDGDCGGDGKSKSPPCRKERDKSGAPSGVQIRERAGQPPEFTALTLVLPRLGRLRVGRCGHPHKSQKTRRCGAHGALLSLKRNPRLTRPWNPPMRTQCAQDTRLWGELPNDGMLRGNGSGVFRLFCPG
jgi:hypothetical protein